MKSLYFQSGFKSYEPGQKKDSASYGKYPLVNWSYCMLFSNYSIKIKHIGLFYNILLVHMVKI